jgi:hypothetical protein
MLSNSGLKDQSKIQYDKISMCADSNELLSDSKLIRRCNRSFKKHDIGEGSSKKIKQSKI